MGADPTAVGGGTLTELHPVPFAERVDVAAQVVQHPGRQLVDIASHGLTALVAKRR